MDEAGQVGDAATTAPGDQAASPAPQPEPAAAGEGQLNEVRERLVHDAVSAGIDEQLVHSAVAEAAAAIARAPVQNFVGILVERSVRDQLQLRPRPD
jgi:hypothetical protein